MHILDNKRGEECCKSTIHVGLEGSHCWVLFYVEKEAFVPINRVVSL
jgi:hypothetical protein